MYRTILLAYDGSLEGRLALREGARLAQICGARVVLLAVVEHDPALYAGDGSGVYLAPEDEAAMRAYIRKNFGAESLKELANGELDRIYKYVAGHRNRRR